MSRIIRSQQAKLEEDQQQQIQIRIRDLFEPETFGIQQPLVAAEPTLTKEELLIERDQLLADAQRQIELERQQFEAFQQEQMAAIEQMKQVWEEEKPTLQQQAYDEAFSQGYEEGVQKAEAQMAEMIAQTNEVLHRAEADAMQHIEAQEPVILHLAMQAAERIIGKALSDDEQTFVEIVRRGLKEVREMDFIKVYVSSTYYSLVSNAKAELSEMFPPDVQFLIFVHDDLQQTECYIETNYGRVVVSIDEQLQQLRQQLYDILESKE